MLRYNDTAGFAHDRINFVQSSDFFIFGAILAGITAVISLGCAWYRRKSFALLRDGIPTCASALVITLLTCLGLGLFHIAELGAFALYAWPPFALQLASWIAIPLALVSLLYLLLLWPILRPTSSDTGIANKVWTVLHVAALLCFCTGLWVWNLL